MLPVGENYGQDKNCFACDISRDTNRHLLECIVLKLKCTDLIENTYISLDDIYSSNMEKVTKAAKLLRSSLRRREIIRNEIVTELHGVPKS